MICLRKRLIKLEGETKTYQSGPAAEVAAVAAAFHVVVLSTSHELKLVTIEVVVQTSIYCLVLIATATVGEVRSKALITALKTKAVLVGRDTAGALLSSQPFDLSLGWRVTLPGHGNWGPDGRDFGDRAVPPHITTELTREAVCRGEDFDLATATGVLESAWKAGQ